jgi:transposase
VCRGSTPWIITAAVVWLATSLRDSEAERSEADGLQFVPAVVAAGSSPVPQRRVPRCKTEASAGTIEVEINGVTVRVSGSAVVRTQRL